MIRTENPPSEVELSHRPRGTACRSIKGKLKEEKRILRFCRSKMSPKAKATARIKVTGKVRAMSRRS